MGQEVQASSRTKGQWCNSHQTRELIEEQPMFSEFWDYSALSFCLKTPWAQKQSTFCMDYFSKIIISTIDPKKCWEIAWNLFKLSQYCHKSLNHWIPSDDTMKEEWTFSISVANFKKNSEFSSWKLPLSIDYYKTSSWFSKT